MRTTATVASACAVLCALGLTSGSAAATDPLPVYKDTHYSFAERAADLVSRMTLEEKVRQLSTNSAPAIPRLGVQQYTYWSEGQHGINRLGAATNPNTPPDQVHATSFPTNFASSMAWDPSLEYQETTAISDEIRGFLDKSLWGVSPNNIGPDVNDYGSLTYWAPTVNMDRDPRWGRTDEAFGEDPYLVGQIAGAFVNGYQGNKQNGQSGNGYLKVAATAKHYALNDVELNRTGISSDASDADIRDYYTAQFRSLIENAHVSGLMTSYNAINGTPSVADTYTTNALAQRTYGFGGYITSDCGAVGTTYKQPNDGHNWAPPGWTTDGKGSGATWTNTASGQKVSGPAGGEAYALRAGTALNCPGEENTLPNIQEAIDAGVLSEGALDAALVPVFTVRMQTGEFDPVGSVPYTKITKDTIQSPAHQALAQQVADNSLVLLKNDHSVLPVNPSKVRKVVVLGDMANKVTLGNYSGQPTVQVGAVGGIKAAIPGAQVIFDAAGTSTGSTGPAVLSAQTQADIKSADLVVEFVGTDGSVANEGHDRSTLAIPGNYHSLITQVAALGNPNTALVVQSDGPVVLDDVQGSVPSILFSGYNGQAQGAALADVLTGKQNPSGHLNFTWYKDDSQLPPMNDYGLAPSATNGLGRTYQYFTGTPSYPFGYGLSYSTFAYSPASIDKSTVNADGTVNVSFTVTNTGRTAGATVAQLYAAQQFTVPNVELPIKRLAGFAKTNVLKPGQSQKITIPVTISDLSLWDGTRQTVYDGVFQFQVASNSRDVAGSVKTTVTGAITPKISYVTVQPGQVEFRAGDTIDLTGKNKWIADDTGQQHAVADDIVMAVNNDQSFVDLSKAKVTYASSNTAVATVDAKGLVRAAGDGVATIKVTVNGVTGTAVVVVGHSLTLSIPPMVQAGNSITATTSFANGGNTAITNVTMSITAPAGWTATATSPASFPSVAGGQTVKTTWQITAPGSATPGAYAFSASATTSAGTRTDVGQVSVPYGSLSAAYDNVGISDDHNTGAANLDGGGLSYSAQALAAAGVASGGAVQHDGLTFTWPTSGNGQPDNVLTGGQSVLLTGSGSKLGFIGTGDSGTPSGGGTIVYTDGTTQQFALGFNDWWSSPSIPGEDVVAGLPYLNNSGGQQTQHVNMYYASVPLQAGKTVAVVTLPNVTSVATQGQPKLHVFAVAAG
ncbi:glycoside hydrolase family 3 C-terminal domain-containing protein [Kutzneria buriramensis]|uniref:Beta-glucosidase-like glycosyl hydrolase n=1 Tax=Kutzneria buriramensis TaxID=1045776 RepID=A0A3E0I527_9PSEU|nr:glycoside hydrolase family 3 C-terminal domain-containing protein [Kutzneria buriramensis]REH53833.1 beta-glucosidase-like glycosyl hydrolase [Kutzneria buriramensis]